jgi:hypothetical protein
VHVEQGTHALTDSTYPDYPGTLNLVVNGQVVATQAVDSSGDYTLNYTPPAGSNGNVQLEAQVSDSVLYQGTDTKTVTIKTTGSFINGSPTTSGAGNKGNNGRGKNLLANIR